MGPNSGPGPPLVSLSKPLYTRIASFLATDKKSLCSLCLVSKSLNEIASSILYKKICVSTHSDVEVLEHLMRGDSEGQSRCALISSCLPWNADYVEEFEVVAIIFPGPNEGPILKSLEQVLPKYKCLQSFIWQPRFCNTELTIGVTRLLRQLRGLKTLSIKVPFLLPEIPKAVSLSKPLQNLEVIAEEDEDEEKSERVYASDAVNRPESGEGRFIGSEVNAEKYEYKPLEDDMEKVTNPQSTLPCTIPPIDLRFLQSLVLASPSSQVLIPLPEILRSLERPIRTLIFEGNCGPVTPRTLINLLPVLQDAEQFGLGLSYSVKYEDLVPFLDGLPKLCKLEIFHYHQLYNRTSPMARLNLLKSFKVRHRHTTSRKEVVSMCVWIRRFISSSSVEELEIECEGFNSDECLSRGPGHGIRYDGLIDHLIARHKASLRVLKMPSAYVGGEAMKRLTGNGDSLTSCVSLEEVHVCVRSQVFDALPELIGTLHRLKEIRLNTVNLKRGVTIQVDQSILREGGTSLRIISVNGRGYRGEWVADLSYGDGTEERSRPKAVFRVSEIN